MFRRNGPGRGFGKAIRDGSCPLPTVGSRIVSRARNRRCAKSDEVGRMIGDAKRFVLAAGVLLLIARAVPAGIPVPLLSNGGFEHGDWEWRSVWGHSGHEVVRTDMRAGGKCMYFSRQGAISSLRYTYHGGPITARGWYRLRDVKVGKRPYWKFQVTVTFQDGNGKGISHTDVCLADGTREWTRFERTIEKAPAGTKMIALSVSLANCTGEAWVDELQLEADAGLDWPAWRFTGQPYFTGRILPEPKSCIYGDALPIFDAAGGSISLRVHLGDHPCRGARFGAEMLSYRVLKAARAVRFGKARGGSAAPVEIVLGRLTDKHVRDTAREKGIEVSDLPPQGHLVRSFTEPEGTLILAAGADDKGVAYAAASLAQMIGIENGRLVLRAFELTDWPDFLLRANSDYMPVSDELLTRLVMNKVSMYAIQHRSWWKGVGPEEIAAPRKGRSLEALLERNRGFVDRTGAIDSMMLIHIYVAGSRPKGETGPVFDIANEEHIADLSRRIDWLYGNSIRCVMICVDDYTDRRNGEYVCKTEAETQRFGNVGRAHGYLMRRLWERLSPSCPGLKLSLVTAPYSMAHMEGIVTRESGERYLRELAEEMPDEVAVVWTGPKITSPVITRKDWQNYAALVPGQPLYLWDNCQGGPPYGGYDVQWYPAIHQDSAWSLMYQNSHFVGWPNTMPAALAANDRMWDLRHYDARASHREACAKSFGPVPFGDIEAVNEGYTRGRRLVADPGRDVAALQALIGRTYEALNRLEAAGVPTAVPRRQLAGASVTPDVGARFRAIPAVRIPRLAAAPVVDGRVEEAAWATAVVLPAFEDYRAGAGAGADGELFPTECRLGYDDEALYIACICRHGDVELLDHADAGKRDGNIFFNSDTIEVFLGPDPAVKRYAHLAVDHTSTVFDEFRPKPGSTWDGDWQAAVGKKAGVWEVELRIPFSTLGVSRPEPGDRWRGNICRAFGQQGQLSCWAPIYGSFHNWTFFGTLEFE